MTPSQNHKIISAERKRFSVIGAIGFMMTLILLPSASGQEREKPDTASSRYLEELVVTSGSARERVSMARLGSEHIELSKIAQLPAFGGEADVIKSLALLPGVRSEQEGGGGFEVRGGNPYQNMVRLDGISLFNPSHVMGIFSTFNDDALGSATLYKGPVPAMYSGASSAVLETSLDAGDMTSYHGSATIGILAAKLKAEGPVVKDRLSFAVTARRSYVDMFLKMIPQYRGTIMNFYDVTTKLRFTPSSGHRVDASFFVSRDNMALKDLMGMHWGNLGASAVWLYHGNGNASNLLTAAFTRHTPVMSMEMLDQSQIMHTGVDTYSLDDKITVSLPADHTLSMGIRSELLRVKTAEWEMGGLREKEMRSLWENGIWAEYNSRWGSHFGFDAGLRFGLASVLTRHPFREFESAYGLTSPTFPKTYFSVEPRVSLRYDINDCHNIKGGVGVSSQNLRALRSSTTTFPFDRYTLTSSEVKPERSLQYSLGYFGMNSAGDFDWSAECYYRDLHNVYDFKDGLGPFSDIDLQSIILGGRGRSYGAEFMVRKNTGKFTGWISYTISRTLTKIAGINDDRWYNASNDRRHDISVTAIWSLSQAWSISGSWIYLSGTPLTVPDVKYELSGVTCYYYSKRNSYKTPPTHRLDLSARYIHVGRKFTYEWAFGVYNAYCRYNPYIIYFQDDPLKPSGTRAVQRSLYGLIPSVSYTLKF